MQEAGGRRQEAGRDEYSLLRKAVCWFTAQTLESVLVAQKLLIPVVFPSRHLHLFQPSDICIPPAACPSHVRHINTPTRSLTVNFPAVFSYVFTLTLEICILTYSTCRIFQENVRTPKRVNESSCSFLGSWEKVLCLKKWQSTPHSEKHGYTWNHLLHYHSSQSNTFVRGHRKTPTIFCAEVYSRHWIISLPPPPPKKRNLFLLWPCHFARLSSCRRT